MFFSEFPSQWPPPLLFAKILVTADLILFNIWSRRYVFIDIVLKEKAILFSFIPHRQYRQDIVPNNHLLTYFVQKYFWTRHRKYSVMVLIIFTNPIFFVIVLWLKFYIVLCKLYFLQSAQLYIHSDLIKW